MNDKESNLSKQSPFQARVPSELVQQIFSLVPVTQALQCLRLCKHIHSCLANDPIFITANITAFLPVETEMQRKTRPPDSLDDQWFQWPPLHQTVYAKTRMQQIVAATWGSRSRPGSIPSCISLCTNLTFLRVNKLVGMIPEKLWDVKTLRHLDLRKNALTGHLSPHVGNLEALRTLDLNQNRLYGDIPREIGGLSQLVFLSLAHNQFSGCIPDELSNLESLETLDLRGNKLCGEIPLGLSRLVRLEELHLSGNKLEGPVPPEFQFLTHLVYLSLRDNKLDTAINAKRDLFSRNTAFMLENQGFTFIA
ncbi:UNVERIFIED_CONTAM: hypothetical protein HDU68_007363 [Siphonaria sp. JEL0065]|nr:hypothetical protein HDU68_007363 [Siphonaria sp. JEL0065]